MVEVARLNESPLNISGQPENDSNIQNITSLSGAEADPNIQNQDGKTLSYDLDLNKKLSDILGQLESDINLLDRPNNIQYIISLLQAGADPNTKGQDGKTLLHYLNERLSDILDQLESNSNSLDNYIQYIISLLEAGADRNTQNQYGKTLSHYSNEPLLNILNALESNGDILDNYLPYIMSLLQAGADPNTKGQNGKTLLYYLDEKLLNI
ncbi:hypothetical protein [Wolbachia endosymbiont (group A) of Myopa testacea]|uniref:hypothetical protein n=1 Tax=Wolbachia endosymbiont (group A) of Myopa testacea TaxID=3066148 RepID=UPI00334271D7